jgi:V/A-type H+-transporting ATPase subunit I
MYSLPSYKEIDPTGVMALVFPFFFGLMIGDMGYGLLLMLTGIIFRTKLKRFEGFPEMGWYVLTAGFVAFVLGLFIFGDAFGIPFHAPEGVEEASWSTLLGFDIPLVASVHKLETSGLATLMVFSVMAAITHLSLGNIFGAINSWGHNRRHSVGKVGWLLVTLGFGFMILKVGAKTSLGSWLWGGVLSPISPSLDTGIGLMIPYATIVLLPAGVVLAMVGEGGMALLEVIGVVSNILSYTRLAAIAIAKAAMAFAFNSVLIPMALGGDIVLAIIGWILLVMAQFMVFVLGALSSGVQALRLNLVEFFMKFYRGGGTEFSPFGHVRKFTTEQGE